MTPEAIEHLCAVDEKLARVIQAAGPCTLAPEKKRSPYEGLIRAVANQQLSGKAASTILGRFIALVPGAKFPKPEQVLALSDEQMQGAGFSRPKVKYIKAIAQATVDGTVPSRKEAELLDDAEMIERLIVLPGIGRWSVEMFLMFGLGRPDVLPIHDLGIQMGFKYTYNLRSLPSPKRIEKDGKRWKPYRTTASWYLWRAVDLARNAKA